jgi:hypothetical protein
MKANFIASVSTYMSSFTMCSMQRSALLDKVWHNLRSFIWWVVSPVILYSPRQQQLFARSFGAWRFWLRILLGLGWFTLHAPSTLWMQLWISWHSVGLLTRNFRSQLEPTDHLNVESKVTAKAKLYSDSPQNMPFLCAGYCDTVIDVVMVFWQSAFSTSISIAVIPISVAAALHWPSKPISFWNHWFDPFHETSAFSYLLHSSCRWTLDLWLCSCCIIDQAAASRAWICTVRSYSFFNESILEAIESVDIML